MMVKGAGFLETKGLPPRGVPPRPLEIKPQQAHAYKLQQAHKAYDAASKGTDSSAGVNVSSQLHGKMDVTPPPRVHSALTS